MNERSPILGLRTCIFKVQDLEKATQWYQKAFKTKPYFIEPYYVGFSVGGFELGLLPSEDPAETVSDNVLVYWGVDNIQAEFDRILALGAAVHQAPENVGGELMVATLIDPWKNVFGLIYNPHFVIQSE